MGSRFMPSMDFGIASLVVDSIQMRDEGIYSCKLVNALGQTANTTGTLKVTREANVDSTTLHPSGAKGLANIGEIEKKKLEAEGKLLPDDEDDESVPTLEAIPPRFTVELPDQITRDETDTGPLRLECTVEPRTDPTLTIDWYHNGMPLELGSRIQVNYEFGLVSLVISDVSLRDRGVYTCKARNAVGTATTFCRVEYQGVVVGVDASAQSQKSVEAINKMEAKMRLPLDDEEEEEDGAPPVFMEPFTNLEIVEGANAYFEAMLTPKKDPRMRIEWTFNGEALQESKTKTQLLYQLGNDSYH